MYNLNFAPLIFFPLRRSSFVSLTFFPCSSSFGAAPAAISAVIRSSSPLRLSLSLLMVLSLATVAAAAATEDDARGVSGVADDCSERSSSSRSTLVDKDLKHVPRLSVQYSRILILY